MTIYAPGHERPLSPTELTIFCASAAGSMNFSMHVEVRGPLDEARLRGALDAAQARHPLLRVRVSAEGRDLWFRSAGVAKLPLRIVDAPLSAVAGEAEREVRTVFDSAQGPLARCVWVRHAEGHATLLITFHHVVGDGISGSFLVRDILRALAGERLEPLPLPESLDGHLPARARGLAGFFGYLRTIGAFGAWILRKGIPRGVPNEARAAYEDRRAMLLFERFAPAFTRALAARCREEGTTVHGAISAAIVLATYADMNRTSAHVMFGSPLNMRDRFEPPIGEDIGFYVAIAVSSHRIDGASDFWALARDLKKGITDGVAADQPFFGLTGVAPFFQLLYRLMGGGPRGRRAATRGLAALLTEAVGLTNIGRVQVAQSYGPFAVEALGFAASVSVLGTNVWTAATLGDTLCLNFVAMEPVISRAAHERIAARVRGLLEKAVVAVPAVPV